MDDRWLFHDTRGQVSPLYLGSSLLLLFTSLTHVSLLDALSCMLN
jgi:hypothetical protein